MKKILLIPIALMTMSCNSIDTPTSQVPSQAESVKETPGGTEKEKYASQPLEIVGVNAELIIMPSGDDFIYVSLTGPDSIKKKIQIIEHQGKLIIKGDPETTGGSGTTIISSNNSTVITSHGSSNVVIVDGDQIKVNGKIISGNNNQIVIGDKAQDVLKIEVTLPKNVSLNLRDNYGKITIGDLENSTAITSDASNITIGKVSALSLNTKGMGDVTVVEVTKNIAVNMMGSGDVKIAKGHTDQIVVTTMGSGDFSFKGNTNDATVSMMGSGDVYIHAITNEPQVNKLGSGDFTFNQ